MKVPHALPQNEAVERLKSETARFLGGDQSLVSDLNYDWNDTAASFSFKVMGFNVDGTAAVQPADVDIRANLPLAAMMFKGTIESTLREKLSEILG
jgi:hypothetical protein